MQVSYVVDGSIRRSSTKPDRALVWLLALRTDAPAAETTHRIEGVVVRALACQAPDDDLPRTCGEPDGSGWTVRSTREERDVLVTAQVDLADRT